MIKENNNLKVEVLINNLLSERNMSLRGIPRLSIIEPSNLSNLANVKRKNIYLENIECIANALEIDDILKILKLSKNEVLIN